MELSRFIKEYRQKNKLTMQEFADRGGLTKGFISQIENDFRNNKGNKAMMPSYNSLKKLAKACGMDIKEFLEIIDTDISLKDEDLYDSSNVSYIPTPIYSTISCGSGGFNDDNITDYVAVPSQSLNPNKKYFAHFASGDSMIDAGIDDGDLLVFEQDPTIEEGMIGAFCIGEEDAVCKKFSRSGSLIVLKPMNNKYDPIIIDITNTCFHCVGRLKKIIKDVE